MVELPRLMERRRERERPPDTLGCRLLGARPRSCSFWKVMRRSRAASFSRSGSWEDSAIVLDRRGRMQRRNEVVIAKKTEAGRR